MKISKGTAIRTSVFVLSWINMILQFTGHSVLPIDSTELSNFISVAFTLVSSIAGFWKNNSFTAHALFGDKAMKLSKAVAFLQDMGIINETQETEINNVIDIVDKSGIVKDIKEDISEKGTAVEKIGEIAKDVVKDFASAAPVEAISPTTDTTTK